MVVDPSIVVGIAIALGTTSTVLCGAIAYWTFVRSTPTVILREVENAVAQSAASMRAIEEFGSRLTAWRTDMEGIADSVEDNVARAETKRRRAVAAETRVNGGAGQQGPTFDQLSRADQIDVLRGIVRAQ